MSKKNYTEEEVTQLLNASLALEKNAALKLHEQIEECTRLKQELALQSKYKGHVQKLKQFVLTLQKEHQQTLEILREKERQLVSCEELASLKSQLEEENRALTIQFEKLKETYKANQKELHQIKHDTLHFTPKLKQTELDQVEQSHRTERLLSHLEQAEKWKIAFEEADNKVIDLNQMLVEAQSQHQRDKQRIEKLASQLAEKDHRMSAMQLLETSLKKSAEQKQILELEFDVEHVKVQRLEKELNENRQHIVQLERALQFLREKAEEAKLESKQLNNEFQKAQEMIQQLSDQQSSTFEEHTIAAAKFSQEQKEKNVLAEEVEALHQQAIEMRGRFFALQHTLQDKQAKLENIQSELLETKSSHAFLLQDFNEKTQALKGCEREIALIKQSLIRGVREAKEIEAQYIETVKEKASMHAKLLQSQHIIEEQRTRIHGLQGHVEAAENHMLNAQQHGDQLNKTITEHQEMLAQYASTMQGKENELFEQQKNSALLKQENDALQTEIAKLLSKIDEKDGELIQAQQYCAKKVKEKSILEDQYEEQKKNIAEMHETLTQNKIRMAELQTSLNLHEQQQVRLQEQLQESAAQAQAFESNWEKKYVPLYEKWQSAENRIKELEKIEEKQKHLQNILANLGNFFGNTTPSEVVPEPFLHTIKTQFGEQINPPMEKQTEISHSSDNLFNRPKTPGRIRQNLLD